MSTPWSPLTAPPGSAVLYRKITDHHDLRVEDRAGCRYLFSGHGRAQKHSCIKLSDLRRHMLDYSRLVFSSLLYVPAPRRALVLGLGGGVIPREMRACVPDIQVDVLEIDPEVLEVSRRFFFLPDDPRLRIWLGDGREGIARLRDEGRQFDWIVLDAFDAEYVPPRLTTFEFMRMVSAIRADPGIVAANIFNSHPLYPAQVATMAAAFGAPLYELRGTAAPSTSIVLAPSPSADRPEERSPEAAERTAARAGIAFALELPRPLPLPSPAPSCATPSPPRRNPACDRPAPAPWPRVGRRPHGPAPGFSWRSGTCRPCR